MQERDSNTMQEKFERLAFWIANYEDGSHLEEITKDGKWNSFKDIEINKLKYVDIYLLTEPDKAVPCFSFPFYPGKTKLVIFRRNLQEIKAGTMEKSAPLKRFIYFGFDFKINGKNNKVRWRMDNEGAVQLVFEDKRKNQSDISRGE